MRAADDTSLTLKWNKIPSITSSRAVNAFLEYAQRLLVMIKNLPIYTIGVQINQVLIANICKEIINKNKG